MVGGKAEVAPEALILPCQLQFLGMGGIATCKAPLPDSVECPDADKEENRPAGIGGHHRRILVVLHEGADHQTTYNSSDHAENNAGHDTGEEITDKTRASDLGRFAHGFPP